MTQKVNHFIRVTIFPGVDQLPQTGWVRLGGVENNWSQSSEVQVDKVEPSGVRLGSTHTRF